MAAAESGFGYPDAVAALEGALRFGIHPSLDVITGLTRVLGDPQEDFRCVQVGGTNGKSSVARMLAALLRSHGVSCGLYTSPHLSEYRERVEVGGEPVSEVEFARCVEAVLSAAQEADLAPTEFEILTAAALWEFRERGVDVAVLEVGMGGRWDATSVVSPAVSVITGVDMDHAEHLGDTLEAIALEKSQIIKAGAVGVMGPGCAQTREVFEIRAGEEGVPLIWVAGPGGSGDVRYEAPERSPGPGGLLRVQVDTQLSHDIVAEMAAPPYQAANIATAIAACEAVTGRAVDAESVSSAFLGLVIPGRYRVLAQTPWLVVDVAHNPAGARALADAVLQSWEGARLPQVLLSLFADKDVAGFVREMSRATDRLAVVRVDHERSAPVTAVLEAAQEVGVESLRVFDDVGQALDVLLAEGDVVVTGGHAVVAEVLRSRRYLLESR